MSSVKNKKKVLLIGVVAVFVLIVAFLLLSNNTKDSPFYGLYMATESDVIALHGEPDRIKEYDDCFDVFYDGLSFQGVDGTLTVRYYKDSNHNMIYADWTLYSADFESQKEYEKACKKFIKLFNDTFESCEEVDNDYIIWENPYSGEYCTVHIYSRRVSFQYRDDM